MKKCLLYIILISYILACKDDATTTDSSTNTSVDNEPLNISYQIIKEYPHDTNAFTEGLQYVDKKIYESVGNYGASDIRITDLATGKVLQSKKLDKKYFGEGLAILNGKAYQLTYKENTAFIYDARTLKQLTTVNYNFGEGWGMTTDGTYLIISTGGSNLYFYNPSTFKEVKRIGIYDQYGPVAHINELEYIKGFIYANLWMTDYILKIDPSNGKVVGKADLSDIRGKYNFPSLQKIKTDTTDKPSPDVLNGIAYDSVNNKIFITGKNWPKLFEVKLDN